MLACHSTKELGCKKYYVTAMNCFVHHRFRGAPGTKLKPKDVREHLGNRLTCFGSDVAALGAGDSSSMVTGPSFSMWTCMYAPNLPSVRAI